MILVLRQQDEMPRLLPILYVVYHLTIRIMLAWRLYTRSVRLLAASNAFFIGSDEKNIGLTLMVLA